ncbi:hypothetical protein ACTXNA_07390 [Psychrobacter celer]|uniref:hypothetical protein n=1 Tax=Psychrobacter celer TaxID=306572 RepID=UPI003FD38E78
MISIPKEVSAAMMEDVLEMGYGWGVLYGHDEDARYAKAEEIVINIIKRFADEALRGNSEVTTNGND